MPKESQGSPVQRWRKDRCPGWQCGGPGLLENVFNFYFEIIIELQEVAPTPQKNVQEGPVYPSPGFPQ